MNILNVFIPLIVFIVLTLLLYSGRNKLPAKTAVGDLILEYSAAWKATGFLLALVLVAGFSGIVIGIPIRTEADKNALIYMGGFVGVGAIYLIIEFFSVRYVVSKAGIAIRSGWRGYSECRWEEGRVLTLELLCPMDAI